MTTYGTFTDGAIWSTGATPEEAKATFYREGHTSEEEYEAINGPIWTAPLTDRLAAYIEAFGFDAKRDSYNTLPDGSLDLFDDSEGEGEPDRLVCSHCQGTILDRSRAYETVTGLLLDPSCARELAQDGHLQVLYVRLKDGTVSNRYWVPALATFLQHPGGLTWARSRSSTSPTTPR